MERENVNLLTSISLLVPFSSLELGHQGFPSNFFREEKVEEVVEAEIFVVGFEIW